MWERENMNDQQYLGRKGNVQILMEQKNFLENGTYYQFIITMFGMQVFFHYCIYLIFSYNYKPKLIALFLNNVESDQTNHSTIQEKIAQDGSESWKPQKRDSDVKSECESVFQASPRSVTLWKPQSTRYRCYKCAYRIKRQLQGKRINKISSLLSFRNIIF